MRYPIGMRLLTILVPSALLVACAAPKLPIAEIPESVALAPSVHFQTASGEPQESLSARKPELLAKLEQGEASERELRLLMAVCSAEGDTACRNDAYAAWKRR